MPDRPLYLHEYHPKSELVVESHELLTPKFPAIDVHGHFAALYSDLWLAEMNKSRPDPDSVVDMLRKCGIRRIVNLDGFWDGFMGITREKVLKTLKPYGDFFINFVSVNTNMVHDKGFDDYIRDHLRTSKEMGFHGIKLFKHVSIMVPDEKGNFVPGRNIAVDDPRLKIIWDTAAELSMPVLIHIADPVAFFRPVDRFNERYEELMSHPDWQFGEHPDMYAFEELMDMQENLLSSNPHTTFIIAHVGSYSENLGFVGSCLDKYPNMYIDIAERINELGRQPYTSRKFFHRYQDRILFGSDAFPWDMEGRYPYYFRFLETWDEYFGYGGRWGLYGIGLEDDILRKVYYQNAEKVLMLEG
ncbi:MAG: amidohydrolase family protein [Caldicoprobacterales bacterium]|nr:amidohydrolase family protein [Clostridiales bacterium]